MRNNNRVCIFFQTNNCTRIDCKFQHIYKDGRIIIEDQQKVLKQRTTTTVKQPETQKTIVKQPIVQPIVQQPVSQHPVAQPIAQPIVQQPVSQHPVVQPIAQPIVQSTSKNKQNSTTTTKPNTNTTNITKPSTTASNITKPNTTASNITASNTTIPNTTPNTTTSNITTPNTTASNTTTTNTTITTTTSTFDIEKEFKKLEKKIKSLESENSKFKKALESFQDIFVVSIDFFRDFEFKLCKFICNQTNLNILDLKNKHKSKWDAFLKEKRLSSKQGEDIINSVLKYTCTECLNKNHHITPDTSNNTSSTYSSSHENCLIDSDLKLETYAIISKLNKFLSSLDK